MSELPNVLRTAGVDVGSSAVKVVLMEDPVDAEATLKVGRAERIRRRDLTVAALTNNWVPEGERDPGGEAESLSALFDVFVESSVEGVRKPDPRMYRLVCERMQIAPSEAAFLDDIGANLKPARALGMTTIIVEQNVVAALELADRAIILDMGQIVFNGSAQDVMESAELRQEYLAI